MAMTAARSTPAGATARRVVFIANSLGIGGAETQLVRVAAGLARRGHEVVVATLLDWPGLEHVLADAGVPVVRLSTRPPVPPVAAIADLVRLLRRVRPDVVVSFDYQANLLGRVVGRAAAVPTIVSSIRALELGGRHRDRLMRLTEPLATVTTTNSDHVAEALLARRLLHPGRAAVIRNGIDVDGLARPSATRARVRRELGVDERTFLWLAVGHFRATKDYPTLFLAVARARARAPVPFRVAVAGGGPALAAHQRAAADRGVADLVDFLGIRHDVPDLLAGADALVQSASSEGLPNAVMEALAAGRPVVATRAGGIPELVTDGHSGLLVDVRDAAALGDRMVELMALRPEQRAAIAAAGQADVADRFGLERLVDEWERLVLDPGRSGAPRRARPVRATASPGTG